MFINHINLSVNNAQEAEKFLEAYFGLKSIDGTREQDTFIAMKDENGFVLTLMQSNTKPSYPVSFHIGFLKQTPESIHALYTTLKQDGYQPEAPKENRGRLDLYIYTPFGFTVQVSA